ncbi:unnamed protein product [Brassica oleracea]
MSLMPDISFDLVGTLMEVEEVALGGGFELALMIGFVVRERNASDRSQRNAEAIWLHLLHPRGRPSTCTFVSYEERNSFWSLHFLFSQHKCSRDCGFSQTKISSLQCYFRVSICFH